jgi:hypothetical protein
MLSKYYDSNILLPDNYQKTVIYMADGRVFIGGLSDRLRAIVSVYKLCKELDISFKINFTVPFNLSNYLLPNIYDWTILPNEICYNKHQVELCYIITYFDMFHNEYAQKFLAKRFFKENFKQIHIYTNMAIAEKEYDTLFKELFRLSPELKALTDYNVKMLGGGGGIYLHCL